MKPRTTVPETDNKYYLKDSYGGYNPCILGNSENRYCEGSVLVNCVGYETGRFNEESNEETCRWLGNTDAENFYDLAIRQGLKVGQQPRAGACMVWAKGRTWYHADGAGHVANVEHVISPTELTSSESGWSYKSKIVDFPTRKKGNGNWGMGNDYRFLGFVYNPSVVVRRIEVNGKFDYATVLATQEALGTCADGVVSRQPKANKQFLPSVDTNVWYFYASKSKYSGGSSMVRAIQILVGADADGYCGPKTVRAIQVFLNEGNWYEAGEDNSIDGFFGPATCKAWQRFINSLIK